MHIKHIVPRSIEAHHRSNNKISIDSIEGKIDHKTADGLVAEALDLISNHNFKPYFYKTLYIIGPEKFAAAMKEARSSVKAECRPCIFVHKLKGFRRQYGK